VRIRIVREGRRTKRLRRALRALYRAEAWLFEAGLHRSERGGLVLVVNEIRDKLRASQRSDGSCE